MTPDDPIRTVATPEEGDAQNDELAGGVGERDRDPDVDEAPEEERRTLIAMFQHFGTAVAANGNRPLLLDDPSMVWLVTGAAIHLFVVPVKDGEADGARLPFTSVEPGNLVFGNAPVEIDGRPHSLLAAGLPDTRLFALPLAELTPAVPDPEPDIALQRQAERWMAAMQRSIRPPYAPQITQPLLAEDVATLSATESAMVYDRSIWVEIRDGGVQLFGLPDVSLGPEDGVAFIATGSWLTAPLHASIGGLDGVERDAVWRAVARMSDLTVRAVVARAISTITRERDRLLEGVAADSEATDRALRQILSVYDRSRPVVVLDPADRADALLAACKLVGLEAGIAVKAPAAQGGRAADPLRAIARASRFRTRQVMLDGQWWREDSGPLLGYVADGDAPVALIPQARGGYVAIDGMTGQSTRIDASVANDLAPWAHMFYRPFPDRAMDARDLLRFGFKGTLRDVWAIVVLGILGGVMGIATPLATGVLVDKVIPGSNRTQLLQLASALIASAMAVAAFTITRNIALLRIEGRADGVTQAAIWDRLLGLPVPFFKDYTSGDLGTRALGIDRIRQSLSDVTTTAILAFVFSVPSFVLQVVIDIKLAFISLGMLILLLLLTALATRRQLAIQRQMLHVGGYLSGLVLQFLTGIPKLRIAGAERRAFSVWANSYSEQSNLTRRNQLIQVQLAVLYAVFPALATVVLFAVFSTNNLEISIGAFLSFNAAFGQIVGATIAMSTAIGTMTMIVPTFERARPILASLPETDDLKADPGVLRGEIEVSGVTFAYNEGDPPTLQDVSFHAKPGEFIAFVGPSGAGKSTLLRLLIGFDVPDTGSVLYDEQNLATLDLQSVRRQMGVVLQNGMVMPGELGQNIIGSSQMTLDDAWEAARMAGLEDDIRQMPMGMHTYIMEGGTALSGGQRQRLMIARAIVNRPRILLFDEATSALDNRTQEIVSRSLEQLNATRIVIAHRLSTIVKADRIHVMVAGRIVQSGTYEELMQQEGPFLQLARRQLI